MVTPDHYATLGLSRTSEDVVVRAAYLALMRRYHPDRNPSPEAAAQARAIAAAYAVLGDPERRSEYDRMRAEGEWAMVPPERPAGLPRGAFAAASMALLALLVSLVVWSPLPLPDPAPPRQGRPAEAPRTGPDAAARPDPPPIARPDEPLPEPPRSSPPPPAPEPPAASAASPAPRPTPRPEPASAPVRPAAARPPAAQVTASGEKPSFNCSIARTRGEMAVCKNPNLTNLDRQQALLYAQSWSRADADKRAQLIQTRERFIARRDACRSDACTSGAYLARMREVSEIMTGKAQPAR